MTSDYKARNFTGKVIEWDPTRGISVIRSDGDQDFYAHIKSFVGNCACEHKHKCEIHPGTLVDFVSVIEALRKGPLPAAMHITVKDDTHAPGV